MLIPLRRNRQAHGAASAPQSGKIFSRDVARQRLSSAGMRQKDVAELRLYHISFRLSLVIPTEGRNLFSLARSQNQGLAATSILKQSEDPHSSKILSRDVARQRLGSAGMRAKRRSGATSLPYIFPTQPCHSDRREESVLAGAIPKSRPRRHQYPQTKRRTPTAAKILGKDVARQRLSSAGMPARRRSGATSLPRIFPTTSYRFL